MLPTPTVSVCIPVYNGERFLAETIRSVLDQTFRDFELVLLENASTDASLDVMRSFGDPRIRIERNRTTLPQPDNWNRVTELCRAPLIKLVCADDLMHPRCLKLQVGPMEADAGLAVVAARQHLIDERSRVLVPGRSLSGLLGVRTAVEVARGVVRHGANPVGGPNAVLFRRGHFLAVGGWRPDHTLVMDLDLWMRLLECGEFLGLPETLSAFRIRRGSVSAENSQAIYAEQRLLTEELGRTPHFQVRGLDRRIGRLLAPVGRARRLALFALSTWSADRDDKVLAASRGEKQPEC